MKNLIILFSIVLVFSGCFIPPTTPTPQFDFSLPNVSVSSKKINAELKSLNVHFAKEYSPDKNFRVIPNIWKIAMLDAIDSMAVFKDDSKNKLNISVKILDMDMPVFGGAMRTGVLAQYDLINRANGKVIYSEEVESEGIVEFSYSFSGYERSIESINRAIKNNIAIFLEDLKKLDIDKLLAK